MTHAWLRDCWQVAAFSSDIGAAIVARRYLDEPVILYRTGDGIVHALADRCAHRALPLSKGRLVGDVVQCGYHGMRYGTDGVCVGVPGQDNIPARAVVRAYPLTERYGFVWIWMGDPAGADPALVPDFHWFDDPTWATARGYHHVLADYRLLNDNLLDLSHESFVHTETIGAAAVADSPVTAQIVDDTVRVYRFMHNFPPPPFYVRAAGFTENIDRWHTTIYRPPGFHVIENGSMPTGADRSQAKERRVLHLITPETATSSHYFWGVARQYDIDDAALTAFIQVGTATTFDQDAVILAAQQTALGPNADDAFPVTIKIDAGPILGRRLLEQKLYAAGATTASA
jgi:vanillate O-demethylase monooxygenase subunit